MTATQEQQSASEWLLWRLWRVAYEHPTIGVAAVVGVAVLIVTSWGLWVRVLILLSLLFLGRLCEVGPLRRWANVQRARRYWYGNSRQVGDAEKLGLTNRAGEAPQLERITYDDVAQTWHLRLPRSGVTIADVQRAEAGFGPLLQAHHVAITPTGPQTVTVRGTMVDAISMAESAEWIGGDDRA